MLSFEEVYKILDEIALSLPPEFYKDLNGGVNLLPDAKLHPESRGRETGLYIMGEYHNDPRGLGRYINIYYGSFLNVYGWESEDVMRDELRKTLLHEFTHHLESLGGEKDLEHEDEREMSKWRKNNPRRNH